MTHQPTHRWLISEDSTGFFPTREGIARTISDAWLAAFAAGREALLNGTICHLAIAVDDEVPQLTYSPSRDGAGTLDQPKVTADLARLQQATFRDLKPHRRAHEGAPGGTRGADCSPEPDTPDRFRRWLG